MSGPLHRRQLLGAAFDPSDGTQRWRTPGDGATSSPAVLDGRLFVATGYGTLLAVGPG